MCSFEIDNSNKDLDSAQCKVPILDERWTYIEIRLTLKLDGRNYHLIYWFLNILAYVMY